MSIDARGELLPGDHQFPSRIRFKVGLDKSSVVGVVTTFAVVLGLIIYNFWRDPTFGFAFWSLTGLGVVFAAVFYFQASSLVERAWPGLLHVAKRLADGSLYVPSA